MKRAITFSALAFFLSGFCACSGSDEETAGSGGAAATGGAGGQGPGTGGQGSGGDAAGAGGSDFGKCEQDSDCLTVADTKDPCYSPGCSLPVGASKSDIAADSCLVPWVDEPPTVPEGCRDTNSEVACLLACMEPPACPVPRCDEGKCVLDLKTEAECPN